MKEVEIKVSVIIPVYNVEKYLARCLDSVLCQTFRNFEVLLVDDGSTDTSGNICDRYGEIDSRVRVFHKVNGGLSDARNYALGYIKGDYVAFIDSDDYVNEKYLEILVSNAINYKADVSICNYRRVGEVDANIHEDIDNSSISMYSREESLKQVLSGEYIMQFCIACGKVYDKRIFYDIRYPKGRKFEDVAVAHLCYNLVDNVVYTDSQLYYYFQREGSIKHSGKYKDTDVIKSAYDRLLFFENYNDGKYLKECKKQYMTSLMGTYARFEDSSEDLKKKKEELYLNSKDFFKRNKKELIGLNVFTARCYFYLTAPRLYAKIVTIIM